MLHPFNAEFWLMLKKCFCQKFCLGELTKLEQQSIEYIKLLTCLVRARYDAFFNSERKWKRLKIKGTVLILLSFSNLI